MSTIFMATPSSALMRASCAESQVIDTTARADAAGETGQPEDRASPRSGYDRPPTSHGIHDDHAVAKDATVDHVPSGSFLSQWLECPLT
jgi:hypothetical protein